MPTFTDKAGREITVEADIDVVAYHGGREIGRLEFEKIYGDHGFTFVRLADMRIDGDYRRGGIATEMMRLAVGHHGHFSRPLLSGADEAGVPGYTPEGASFVSHCIAAGILKPDFRDQPAEG